MEGGVVVRKHRGVCKSMAAGVVSDLHRGIRYLFVLLDAEYLKVYVFVNYYGRGMAMSEYLFQQKDKSKFYKLYQKTEEDLKKAGLEWSNLEEIGHEYLQVKDNLLSTGKTVVDLLRVEKRIHSLKMRVKNPDHVIEKIIRKRLEDPTKEYTVDNYRSQITDLIGVRAIHLYKNDWEKIDDFIKSKLMLREKPIAFYRDGDNQNYTETYLKRDCVMKEHPYGYRSVHYNAKMQLTREEDFVEIQVRTIFEEGWSEIDHKTRYPLDVDNPILVPYLQNFNLLAGLADNMATYIDYLMTNVVENDKSNRKLIEAQEKTIVELKDQIESLKLDKGEKDKLTSYLTIFEKNLNRLEGKNIPALPLSMMNKSFVTLFCRDPSGKYEIDPVEYTPKKKKK